MTSNLVKDAIIEIKAGNKAQARKLLVKVLKQNNQDDEAWYVMAFAVEKNEQHIECLERAIAINPQNKKARRALEKHSKPAVKSRLEKAKSSGVIKWVLLSVIPIGLILCCGALYCIYNSIADKSESAIITPLAMSSSTTTDELLPTEIPSTTPEQPTPTYTSESTNTLIPTKTSSSLIPPIGSASCVPKDTKAEFGEVINVIDGEQSKFD
jgi:hypothetical protein